MANFLQTPAHSTVAFGLENSVLYNNYPLHKFEFAVRIVFNSIVGADQRSADSLVFIVKSVKMPSVNINVDEINEYNRTRYNYGRLQFGECSLTLHDVSDGKVLQFWKDYYQYYFSDGGATEFGYTTTNIPDKNSKYVIDSVDIFQFQAGRTNRTTLMSPKIISFDQGNVAYDDLTGICEIAFGIRPEFITYGVAEGLPEEILQTLAQGAPADSLSSAIASFLPPPINQALLDASIGAEIGGTLAASLSSQFLNNNVSAFDVNIQQSIQRQSTVSSSALDSFGIAGSIFRIAPGP